ncbi:MAG: hypothetical protein DRO06_00540 [Thermoproteota archaeon]|nr:MAG: hypothetical protein DRO06_00540 [Candidatus Korarchaeota archaeon]
MGRVRSYILSGVGGQGVIRASDALGRAALSAGLEVLISEHHGLAQREGSVWSHIKIGRPPLSPKIRSGRADFVLGFELMESARNLPFLSDRGLMISNESLIYPVPHYTGDVRYPEKSEVLEGLRRELGDRLILIEADRLAMEAGSPKVVSAVMLGALAGLDALEFDWELLLNSLVEVVPRGAEEINRRAFRLGMLAVR